MPGDLLVLHLFEFTLPNSEVLTHPLPQKHGKVHFCYAQILEIQQISRKSLYKGTVVPLHQQKCLQFILSQLSSITIVLIPYRYELQTAEHSRQRADRHSLTSLTCLPRLMPWKGCKLPFIPVGPKPFRHSWPGDYKNLLLSIEQLYVYCPIPQISTLQLNNKKI